MRRLKNEYKSSNPAVTSIDSKGKIVGLKAGETTITAENKELNIKEKIEIDVSKELATVIDYTTVKCAFVFSPSFTFMKYLPSFL